MSRLQRLVKHGTDLINDELAMTLVLICFETHHPDHSHRCQLSDLRYRRHALCGGNRRLVVCTSNITRARTRQSKAVSVLPRVAQHGQMNIRNADFGQRRPQAIL